eukprot:gb/GEZN01004746.1/.p1 GENE.gb/GEZN01004746.1/~~gb/GEZN01004746.1/.p1  ORF type:complete len:604 (-),score=42.77 gb/GEZN01004746.1/:32-1843(-)
MVARAIRKACRKGCFLLLLVLGSSQIAWAQTWQNGLWTNCGIDGTVWSRSVVCGFANGTEVGSALCNPPAPTSSATCSWANSTSCAMKNGRCTKEMKATCDGGLGAQECSEDGAAVRACAGDECKIPFAERDLGTAVLLMAMGISVLVMLMCTISFCVYYAKSQKLACFEKLLTPGERKARANMKREADLMRDHDSYFKQQKFHVWVPRLTPRSVICTFLFLASWCLVMSFLLFQAQTNVVEVQTRYDNLKPSSCRNATPVGSEAASICELTIEIKEDMPAPIFLYYKIVDFYQSHQNYVKSRDEKQIRGVEEYDPEDGNALDHCEPMIKYEDMERKYRGAAYNTSFENRYMYPCGLIAYTMFTDTFTNPRVCNSDLHTFNTTKQCLDCECLTGNNYQKEGIAWDTDLEKRFKQRTLRAYETSMNPRGFQMPPVDDEDFVVWMRCAHLPTFYKVHRKILDRGLKKGEFLHLTVLDSFPTYLWQGQKWVVLTTLSWVGSSDLVLLDAHVVLGVLSILAALFFLINYKAGRLQTQSDHYAVLELQMSQHSPSAVRKMLEKSHSHKDIVHHAGLPRPVPEGAESEVPHILLTDSKNTSSLSNLPSL